MRLVETTFTDNSNSQGIRTLIAYTFTKIFHLTPVSGDIKGDALVAISPARRWRQHAAGGSSRYYRNNRLAVDRTRGRWRHHAQSPSLASLSLRHTTHHHSRAHYDTAKLSSLRLSCRATAVCETASASWGYSLKYRTLPLPHRTTSSQAVKWKLMFLTLMFQIVRKELSTWWSGVVVLFFFDFDCHFPRLTRNYVDGPSNARFEQFASV